MITQPNRLFVLMTIFIVVFAFPSAGICKRGCCSHHGGVCGGACCDGTPLSAKCRGTSYSYPSTSYKSTYKKTSSSNSSNSSKTYNKKTTQVEESKGYSVIVFKDGRKIKTEDVWEENNQYKCYRFGAVIGYPKSDIDRIETVEE